MPQPIDPQSELARVSQAERVQQFAERAAINAQLRASDEMAAEDLAMEQQVRQTRQKDEHVDEENRRRNPYAGRRKKRSKEEDQASHVFYDEHERPEIADDDQHNLDITI